MYTVRRMPKTIQIRDIEDDVYTKLVRRAAESGVSVPELLRREATRLAARPSFTEWLERTRRRRSDVTTDEVLGHSRRVAWGMAGCWSLTRSCLYEVRHRHAASAPLISERLAADTDHAAPHVIDVEVMGVIRAHALTGRLDGTAAQQAVDDLARLARRTVRAPSSARPSLGAATLGARLGCLLCRPRRGARLAAGDARRSALPSNRPALSDRRRPRAD